MKMKDTFMSSPICVKILKYQVIRKKLPFAFQTIFSLHSLEADNFFQPTTACEHFFLRKRYPSPPPTDKNNGPSLMLIL